jgi:hypothetical protein
MTPDAIAEAALLGLYRAAGNYEDRYARYLRWYDILIDGLRLSPERALSIIESVRREEEAEHRRAA